MTCATFITAALKTYEYELCEISSWPDRPEDAEWQSKILVYLERKASADHLAAVKASIGGKRLRPDEVVGAAIIDAKGWPVKFEIARELADQVLVDLS
ncbi:hypothetical protein CWR43_06955 [Rhizobium sullae]|uniref:Uncharacterized protein n=1 Tax=Rhizobium sullae TaxID=50338 RepID=A0A2N0DD85_RHISU|nr:hypothetical protein CWR43_06955 [Rhizobium sullae]